MIKTMTAPYAARAAADLELLQPNRATHETTAGPSINPRLPPLATRPLAKAPALKCFTAISKRNVVPAVSSTPAATERHRSYQYVIAVRLFVPASKARAICGRFDFCPNKFSARQISPLVVLCNLVPGISGNASWHCTPLLLICPPPDA